MKDNFSQNSENYLIYRPSYPEEVYNIICSCLETKQNVWDCGTGNGQVASRLAQDFETIYATDISQNQIKNAIQKENIIYLVEQAEHSSFEADFFDLIIVAQAIHWFDFEKFYQEVNRTLKKDGIFVILGYGKLEVDEEINKIIDRLYFDILGNYWDNERKYIDDNYQTIPFPFEEISILDVQKTEKQELSHKPKWNVEQLIGYLNTWSAIKHYNKENALNEEKLNLIASIYQELREIWNDNQPKTVNFPTLFRIGKLKK